MNKTHTLVGAIFIAISIILGAIAAHSLEKIISPDLIHTFTKGVTYMMYSGLGLLILGLNQDRFSFSIKPVYLLLEIGTLLFSGNIFIYIFHEQVPALFNFVHIVPVGGSLMIIGWALFILKLSKLK